MKLKTTIFSILFVFFCSVANAEISADKRSEIEKMMQLTGMEKLMEGMMGQMISSMKPAHPELPEAFWDKLAKAMDSKEIIELIIPIYDKHYSLDDLKAINAFYQTPAGQKVLSTLPQVMQESVQAGQAWGEKIGARISREIEAEKAKSN